MKVKRGVVCVCGMVCSALIRGDRLCVLYFGAFGFYKCEYRKTNCISISNLLKNNLSDTFFLKHFIAVLDDL